MSVYKEGVYAIQLINQKSKRIYPDAADFGAPVKKGDDVWNWAKQLVEWYGVKGTRKIETYSTGTTVENIVSLMMDEHNSSKYTKFKVSYVTTRKDKDMDGYITVEKI